MAKHAGRSRYALVVPGRTESDVAWPTWSRQIGQSADGQAVTLAMVLEDQPASRHEDLISEHLEVLEHMIRLADIVMTSTSLESPERRPIGFNLLLFAGELASVLQEAMMGAFSLEPFFRRKCLEAIAAATLNAGGCLVATSRLPERVWDPGN
ncbi:MAG: hypothetical protein WA938_06395 [Candidatus Dormiibacterota bacterium]